MKSMHANNCGCDICKTKTIMEQTSLYGGNIILNFNKTKHVYTIDDKEIPSVTHILDVVNKPKLIDWAVSRTIEYLEDKLKQDKPYTGEELQELLGRASWEHTRIKEISRTSGSYVHKWIEHFVKDSVELEITGNKKKEQRMIEGFLKWHKENNCDFVYSEVPVYSQEYNYCGTLDLMGYVNGKFSLVDIKTSNFIHPEYVLQTAAYAQAYYEENKLPIDQRIIVRLDKSGNVQTVTLDDFKKDFDAFKSALHLYNTLEEYKQQLNVK